VGSVFSDIAVGRGGRLRSFRRKVIFWEPKRSTALRCPQHNLLDIDFYFDWFSSLCLSIYVLLSFSLSPSSFISCCRFSPVLSPSSKYMTRFIFCFGVKLRISSSRLHQVLTTTYMGVVVRKESSSYATTPKEKQTIAKLKNA